MIGHVTNQRRQIVWEIILVFLLALSIRCVPAIFNWGWGNDFGIYYGLTEELVRTPQLFRPYTGWGQTYNYFPMLYLIIAFFHVVTGLDIPTLLRTLSPIIGAMSVVFFYLFVRAILKGRRKGGNDDAGHLIMYLPFLASIMLAMNPFHAYQTSHPAPLTVGHMAMTLCLWLFVIKNRHTWALHLLYPATIMLVMSHHLTTFVYVVLILGIIFFKALSTPKPYEGFISDIMYLTASSAIVFGYWALIATPVFYGFIPSALGLPPISIVAVFYICVFLMVAYLYYRWHRKMAYIPPLFERKREYSLALFSVGAMFLFVWAFTFTDLGTGFIFLPLAPVFLAPTLVLFGFGVIGMNRSDLFRFAPYPKGMFFPLAIVLLFSVVTWNPILFPFRFLEYIAYPLAVYMGVGILCVLADVVKSPATTKMDDTMARGGKGGGKGAKVFVGLRPGRFHKLRDIGGKRSIVATILIAVIIFLSGATTYAVQRTTAGYEESISSQVALAIEYLKANAPPNTTVASDHRISTLLWEAGFNATYDGAYDIWFSPNWNDTSCINDLIGNGGDGGYYGRVDYIVIDSVMVRDGVQSNINESPRAIEPKYYEKFNHQPFELVFEARSKEKIMSEEDWSRAEITGEYRARYPYIGTMSSPLPNAINWCRVYSVNWTHISQSYNLS